MRCATGKVRHPDKVSACIAAKRFRSNLLNVFRCSICKGWHIGNSNNQFRVQKRFDQIFRRDAMRLKPCAQPPGGEPHDP